MIHFPGIRSLGRRSFTCRPLTSTRRFSRLPTPMYFRDQILALRPPELVSADIRIAALSLAEVRDPMALVRLALSAREVSERSFNMPNRETLFPLLILTGKWKTAVEHMEFESETFAEEDIRTARLRMSLLLFGLGHRQDAWRVFEANEPWDVLSGSAEAHELPSPYQLLYAWAAAAAVLRGSDAVLEAAQRLQLPRDRGSVSGENDDPSRIARAWMLAVAADELENRDQQPDAASLLALLDPERREDRNAWVWFQSRCWRRKTPLTREAVEVVSNRFSPQDLEAKESVAVAEGLYRLGLPDEARLWISDLSQPPLSDAIGGSDLWQEEDLRYRLNRLFVALGDHLDPESLVPAPVHESEWAASS